MNEFAELIKKVDKHDEDLYFGDGRSNPSITTRLAMLERDSVMTTEKLEKYDSLMNKALIASLTSAGAVIAFLVKVIFFPHAG